MRTIVSGWDESLERLESLTFVLQQPYEISYPGSSLVEDWFSKISWSKGYLFKGRVCYPLRIVTVSNLGTESEERFIGQPIWTDSRYRAGYCSYCRYFGTVHRCGTFDVHLPKYLHPITGRLHPSWFQYGARSGRYSCKDPALQVIPRTPEARRGFIAEPGNVLIKADFSRVLLTPLQTLYPVVVAANEIPTQYLIEEFLVQLTDRQCANQSRHIAATPSHLHWHQCVNSSRKCV